MHLSSQSIGMCDDRAKVLDYDANMQAFLNVEVVEVFPLQSYSRVHWLFQDFSAVLDLLCVAGEGDFSVLEIPVEMVSFGSEVLYHVSQSPRRYGPEIVRCGMIEARMQYFPTFVVQSVRLNDAMFAYEPEDKATLCLIRLSLKLEFTFLKSTVPISCVGKTASKGS